jgi:hypothetical protein
VLGFDGSHITSAQRTLVASERKLSIQQPGAETGALQPRHPLGRVIVAIFTDTIATHPASDCRENAPSAGINVTCPRGPERTSGTGPPPGPPTSSGTLTAVAAREPSSRLHRIDLLPVVRKSVAALCADVDIASPRIPEEPARHRPVIAQVASAEGGDVR